MSSLPAQVVFFLRRTLAQKGGERGAVPPAPPSEPGVGGKLVSLGKWAWLATRMKPLVKAPQGAPSAEGRATPPPPPLQERGRATNGCGFDGGEGVGEGGDGGGVRAWAGWVAGGGWVEGLQQT